MDISIRIKQENEATAVLASGAKAMHTTEMMTKQARQEKGKEEMARSVLTSAWSVWLRLEPVSVVSLL